MARLFASNSRRKNKYIQINPLWAVGTGVLRNVPESISRREFLSIINTSPIFIIIFAFQSSNDVVRITKTSLGTRSAEGRPSILQQDTGTPAIRKRQDTARGCPDVRTCHLRHEISIAAKIR